MKKKKRTTLRDDEWKTKLVLIIFIGVAILEVGFAIYITQIHRPETSVYVEEVFHYTAKGENRTRLWTIGTPGRLAIRRTHNFTVGYCYRIEGKEINPTFIDPERIYEYPRKYNFRDKIIPEYIKLERGLNVERRPEHFEEETK
jgi:hypothetical protein